MHRFYVEMADGRPRLQRAQLHQIRSVLRLRDGDEIGVFDGSGAEWVARVTVEGAELVRPLDESREPTTRLTLYQALIKPARFEFILQKGTELGIARFVPFVAQRSMASGERSSRWRKIAMEAAEQSGRTVVPEVNEPLTFDEALADATSHSVPFMPWENAERPRLSSVHRHCQELGLIVGPEGGFSDTEIEQARARGAVTVTLGRRILRSETAALVAAALLFHLNGEM